MSDCIRVNTKRRGNIHGKLCHLKKNSISTIHLELFQRACPFWHHSISAVTFQLELINEDKRKETLEARGRKARRLSTSHAHLCTCTKAASCQDRFHVLDAFRRTNLAESGARPGRRRSRWKRRETSKIAMWPANNKLVGEALTRTRFYLGATTFAIQSVIRLQIIITRCVAST